MNGQPTICVHCGRIIKQDAVSRTGWVHVFPDGNTDTYCGFKPMATPRIVG